MAGESMGVSLEQNERFIVAYDYNSERIYSDESDIYFRYDGDLILKEDWMKYSEGIVETMTVNDLIEENRRWE